MTVCRDCCCGTKKKHPDVDHDGQVRQLKKRLDSVATVRVVDCLDACKKSNVVVVSPSPDQRKKGARPVWLGWVLDNGAVTDVIDWVRAGGPGASALPDSLDLQTFAPERKSRKRV